MGISTKINPGDRVAIIGNNGSGKSTLLNSISGFLRPLSGTIKTEGRVLLLSGSDPGFSVYLTGRENVNNLALAYGISKDSLESFSEKILIFSELGEDYDRKYGNYSTGMKGKLGFGFISHLECDILLIDEVFGAGDRDFKTKAKEKMVDLITNSATVIMCTHSMTLAKEICNKCIVLERGNLVFEGDIEDGISFYKSLKKSIVNWIDLPRSGKSSNNETIVFNIKEEFGIEEDIRLVIYDSQNSEFCLLEEIAGGGILEINCDDLPNQRDLKFKLQQFRFGRWYDSSKYAPIYFEEK